MLEVSPSEIRILQHNDALHRFEIRTGSGKIIRLAANSGLSALIYDKVASAHTIIWDTTKCTLAPHYHSGRDRSKELSDSNKAMKCIQRLRQISVLLLT